MNRFPVHDSLMCVDKPAAIEGGNPAAGGLRPGWWMRALTERERVGGSPMTPPVWAGVAERAVAAATVPAGPPAAGFSRAAALAIPFRPFVLLARDRLADGTRHYLPAPHADPKKTAEGLATALGRALARISARTMTAELAAARSGGRGARGLPGSGERDRLADFVRWHCTPEGLAGLLDSYPVLARMLGTASLRSADAGLELLKRFAADRDDIVATLLETVDPGPITAIEPFLGDPHGNGRSVTRVSFADGRRIVYKPRGIAAQAWFGDVVSWLNDRIPQGRLRTAAVLVRPGYGWTEFIGRRPPAGPGEADLFGRRAGVLLAVLYVLGATDIGYRNLIASGGQPFCVDVETVLQPGMTASGSAADPAPRITRQPCLRGSGWDTTPSRAVARSSPGSSSRPAIWRSVSSSGGPASTGACSPSPRVPT